MKISIIMLTCQFTFFFTSMIHPKLKFNDNEFYYRVDAID